MTPHTIEHVERDLAGPENARPSKSAPADRPTGSPTLLQQLVAMGNARAARVLGGRSAPRIQRMNGDGSSGGASGAPAAASSSGPAAASSSSSSSSDGGPRPDFVPTADRTFYKAVRLSAVGSIKTQGLLRAMSGGSGSLTVFAAAQSGRPYNADDRRGQFLTPFLQHAETYAEQSTDAMVVLRVEITDDLARQVHRQSDFAAIALVDIPPGHVSYRSAKDAYTPISQWTDGADAYDHQSADSDEEQGEFE